jgi:hypothetical protein
MHEWMVWWLLFSGKWLVTFTVGNYCGRNMAEVSLVSWTRSNKKTLEITSSGQSTQIATDDAHLQGEGMDIDGNTQVDEEAAIGLDCFSGILQALLHWTPPLGRAEKPQE